MAIKQLSINNAVINFDNIPKLDQQNNFHEAQRLITNSHYSNYYIRAMNFNKNVNDSGNIYLDGWAEWGLTINDENNDVIGSFRTGISKELKTIYSFMRVQHISDANYEQLKLSCDTDNYCWCSCPTPKTTASGSEIVTASWVRKLLQSKGL